MPRPKAGANDAPSPPTYDQYLTECSFRGVAIPNAGWESGWTQSNVIHKPVDRDGAYVEMTGRDPYTFQVSAPFYNHIVPASYETWTYGNLFPRQYDLVKAACLDRSIGTLNHPAWGSFDARCTDWKETFDPKIRNGYVVTISFIETIKPTFDTVGVTPDAASIAVAYDTALAPLSIPDEALPDPGVSFFDLVNDLIAAVDQGALAATTAIAKADRVLYQLDRVEQSFKRATDSTNAAARNLGERLTETVIAIKRAINQGPGASVRRFRADRDMSMLALVQRLNNDVATIIKLNPDIVGSTVIREGTYVRYLKNWS